MRCCIENCYYRGSGKRFFSFPRDEERRRLWLDAIGNPNINPKTARVCNLHFDENCLKMQPYAGALTRGLTKFAVPTKLLNLTFECRPLRVVPAAGMDGLLFEPEVVPPPAIVHVEVSTTNPERRHPKRVLKKASKSKTSLDGIITRHMRKRIEKYRETGRPDVLLELLGKLDVITETFLMGQAKCNRETSRRHFSLDEKLLCVALYQRSPRMYRFLQAFFVLPPSKALRKTLGRLTLLPGINNIIFRQLCLSVRDLVGSVSKTCVLMFGEMRVKPALAYSFRTDAILGFEDFGDKRRPVIADRVLVFMLRCLGNSWKQPVAFMSCSGSPPPHMLVRSIRQVVMAVHRTGLDVVATVSDEGMSNIAAVKMLARESRAAFVQTGRVFRCAAYYIGDKAIVHIFDPPHLMKSVRDNLLTKDALFTMNNQTFMARWKDIVDFHKLDLSRPYQLRTSPMTAVHLELRKIPKTKVKHAVQALSRTAACGIHHYIQLKRLPMTATGTCQFCSFFDTLFDSVNGAGDPPSPLKRLACAVTSSTRHVQYWNEAVETLGSMKFIDSLGRTIVPSCIINWRLTIKAIKVLWENLQVARFQSLSPRFLNQDPLENFFGCVRDQGCFNMSPTVASFPASFKAALLPPGVSPRTPASNCEDDGAKILVTLKSFLQAGKTGKASSDLVVDELPDIIIPFPKLNEYVTPDPVFLSGVLAKRLMRMTKTENCKRCRRLLIPRRRLRRHALARDPDVDLLAHLYGQTSRLIAERLPNICHLTGIRRRLGCTIKEYVDVSALHCGVHDLSDAFVKFCCKFIVFNWCKHINRLLAGQATRARQDLDFVQQAALKAYKKRKPRKRKRM